jgi:ribose transport system substrate-binding protein
MMEEAEKRGYELLYRDAQSDIDQAVEDVKYFVSQKVDYIFLAPRLIKGLEPALKAAKDANIRVILLDRTTNGVPGEDFVTCIMGNFIEVGERAAKILAEKFEGRECNIVHMMGTKDASCVRDLAEGFRQEVAKHPNMKIIAESSGNFERTPAQKEIEKIIQEKGDQIDAIFGHSDEEGIASIQALKAAGFKPGTDPENNEVCIVSMCGMLDAFKAIIAGDLLASIECSPRFGPIAYDTMEKDLRGEKIPTYIERPGKTYTKENAQKYLYEAY